MEWLYKKIKWLKRHAHYTEYIRDSRSQPHYSLIAYVCSIWMDCPSRHIMRSIVQVYYLCVCGECVFFTVACTFPANIRSYSCSGVRHPSVDAWELEEKGRNGQNFFFFGRWILVQNWRILIYSQTKWLTYDRFESYLRRFFVLKIELLILNMSWNIAFCILTGLANGTQCKIPNRVHGEESLLPIFPQTFRLYFLR